jgi:hypothetical protein
MTKKLDTKNRIRWYSFNSYDVLLPLSLLTTAVGYRIMTKKLDTKNRMIRWYSFNSYDDLLKKVRQTTNRIGVVVAINLNFYTLAYGDLPGPCFMFIPLPRL